MTALPYFDAASVAAGLPLASLIEAAPELLSRAVSAPVRLRTEGADGCELLAMPAISGSRAAVKLLTVVPANAGSDRPVIGGLVVLFDMAIGVPLAIIDAPELTARRTAAVSGLASRALAREDAATLLLVGAGHLVPYLAEAHALVRPIRTIRLWARDFDKAKRTAALIAERLPQISVTPARELESAVRDADIVSSATRATRPLIRGAWVAPGTHIDLVGGYRPDMREIDDAGISLGRIFADTREGALAEAGDLLDPLARGVITLDAVHGDLGDLLAGMQRTNKDEVTLFKSVGTAFVDLAAAGLLWDRRGQ